MVLGGLTGCRGMKSDQPPIHPNPNMDIQDKYKPYRASNFFKDKRSMRVPPKGTVARGKLRADDALWRGKDAAGNLIERIPFVLKVTDVQRGQDRYNIYCAPCHDMAGYGKGTVAKKSRGKINPPSFHTPRLGKIAIGHIYDVITNGSASKLMWPYRHQIPEAKDRWRIAAYVRALQRSQSANRGHVYRYAPDKLKAVDEAFSKKTKK
jgi:cytochrome c